MLQSTDPTEAMKENPLVVIEHAEGKLSYRPLPDITTYELTQIGILLLFVGKYSTIDWPEFIGRHGLTRHFIPYGRPVVTEKSKPWWRFWK